jgi:hypothetical protein
MLVAGWKQRGAAVIATPACAPLSARICPWCPQPTLARAHVDRSAASPPAGAEPLTLAGEARQGTTLCQCPTLTAVRRCGMPCPARGAYSLLGLSPVHGVRSPHPSCDVNPIRGAHLPFNQPQLWWRHEEPVRRISRSAPGTGAFTCAAAVCTKAPRASSRAQQRRRLPVTGPSGVGPLSSAGRKTQRVADNQLGPTEPGRAVLVRSEARPRQRRTGRPRHRPSKLQASRPRSLTSAGCAYRTPRCSRFRVWSVRQQAQLEVSTRRVRTSAAQLVQAALRCFHVCR